MATKKSPTKASNNANKNTSKKLVTKAAKKASKKITKKAVKKAAKKSSKPMGKPSPLIDLMGKAVPSFSAEATGGSTVTSESLKGQNVVLYFYPKDNTPGCTIEGKDFSDLNAQFAKANTKVFGISRDSIKSHEGFKAKMCFPFELLSDPEQKLCEAFGVMKMKSLYGREYLGVDRSTFVVDAQGKVRREWRAVSVKGHAQEVLDFVKSL